MNVLCNSNPVRVKISVTDLFCVYTCVNWKYFILPRDFPRRSLDNKSNTTNERSFLQTNLE